VCTLACNLTGGLGNAIAGMPPKDESLDKQTARLGSDATTLHLKILASMAILLDP
jgi:hypothetical protein